MREIPDPVRELARRREEARRRREFDRADLLREEIRAAGFDVTDGPDGSVLTPAKTEQEPLFARSHDVPTHLEGAPSFDVSVHWLGDEWPEDTLRGIESIERHAGRWRVQHVVVDGAEAERKWPHAEVIRVEPAMGWAAMRNAGLRRAAGHVVVIADGSVEAEGDALGPLVEALADPTVGLTGPFGVVSEDLRQFHQSEGPDVDAIEAYIMAFRRDLLVRGVRFDEHFRFYRNADLDFSFRVKALGLRAVITPAPVRRHAHRRWEAMPEDRRSNLSKRNFYRFLKAWRSREDLLVSNQPPGG